MNTGPSADVPADQRSPGFFAASWTPEALAQRGWRGGLKAGWRVIATTWYGVFDNRLPQQSAALT